MTKISRLLFLGAMILVLLTSACAGQDSTPTLVGTSLPTEETGTPAVTTTAETSTTDTGTGTAETAVETPTASGTDATAVSTSGTQTTGTQTTGTPVVPVTGFDIVLVECQFCVDTTAHALLVLPDTATFEITSPDPATTTSTTSVTATTPICTTVEVTNGKQVVLCSGPEMTPITLNICTDTATCTDFPVDLLACPLTGQPTALPNDTTNTPAVETTDTPGIGLGTATATLSVTISTPTP